MAASRGSLSDLKFQLHRLLNPLADSRTRMTLAGWAALLASVFFLPVQGLAFQGAANAEEATDNSSKPVAQAVAHNEPQGDKPHVEKQTDIDPATRLGRATHERMSAIDRLPKLYITSNNVRYEDFVLEDPSEDPLDNLTRSLDLNTRDKRFGRHHDEFGWDENYLIRGSGDSDERLQWYWGTRETGGRVSDYSRDPKKLRGRPTVFRDAHQVWASMGPLPSNYMRASRHTLWFGASHRYRSFARNCIPANIANYKQLADMKFDGELCQVVRSTARQEMLIISKASGLLRGYVVIKPKRGVSPFFSRTDFYAWADSDKSKIAVELRSALKDITGNDFSTKLKFLKWYRKNEANLSVQQKWELEAAVLVSLDWSEPTLSLLVRFRNYREIAPGIMWPFREDYVRARGINREGKLFSERTYSDVKEIRIDKDLTGRVNALRPKEGEQVSDFRFQAIIGYQFSRDRTNEEIMKMVDIAFAKKMKDQGLTRSSKKSFEDMLGKPAPILPAKNWVSGERPIFDGKPYLIHFWATWYGPCKNDLAILKQLAEAGATVVGAHPSGTSSDDLSEAIKAANLPYPTHLLPSIREDIRHLDLYPKIATVYPRSLLPYCVLVDSNGQVVAHGGLSEDGNALLEKFRSLIKTTDKELNSKP